MRCMQHSYVDEDRKQLHHATGCFAYKCANLNLNDQRLHIVLMMENKSRVSGDSFNFS